MNCVFNFCKQNKDTKNSDELVKMVELASLTEIEGPEGCEPITSLLDYPEDLISTEIAKDSEKASEFFKE